jgi:phage antirepressor YoqD-like protein
MQDEKIVNFGEKKMYAWLRENGYLNNNNEPYQKYCQYFKLDEGTVNTAWGVKITKTTLIRPKGQVYLYQKLKEKFAA